MALEAGSGGAVVAGDRLAGGGQGEVFDIAFPPGLVYKRYLTTTLAGDSGLEQRIRVMVAGRPAHWREQGSGHMSLAWPTELVHEDGNFTGFLMPAVDMRQTVGLHRVTNPTDRQAATGDTAWLRGFSWQYLVQTAVNLAHATDVLHESGVVIGDFNESNIRVWRDARITLLDCDSMQIRDQASGEWFLSHVGRPEFTPPELFGADWTKTVRHPSSDLFALAIHLYQLLLEGEHPFRGVWHQAGDKPPVSELSKQGTWTLREGGVLTPRPAAVDPTGLLPLGMIDMFRRAFEDGATDPFARPTAAEWKTALTGLTSDLRRCGTDRAHYYPAGREPCPWCTHAVRVPPPRPAPSPPAPPPAVVPGPVPGGTKPARVRALPALALTLLFTLVLVASGWGVASIFTTSSAPSGSGVTSANAKPAPARARPPSTLAATLAIPGAPGSIVSTVTFSPDGKLLAIGDGGDGRTWLWDRATSQVVATFSTPDDGGIYNEAFSPDGKLLAVADDNGAALVWDVATRRLVVPLLDPGKVGVYALAFSPDGKLLATGDVAGVTYLWDTATWQETATLTGRASAGTHVNSVTFSRDGRLLAAGISTADGDTGRATVWNTATGRLITTITTPKSQGGGVNDVAFSPDSKMLSTGSGNGYAGTASLWDPVTGHLIASLAVPGSTELYGVSFSPDGKMLAVADSGGVDLWNTASRHLISTMTDPVSNNEVTAVNAIAFSPDGTLMASADYSGSTYLWHINRLGP